MNAPISPNSQIPATSLTLKDRIDQKIFNALYSRSLVYNTCWEDPAVDRQVLRLGPQDSVMVITSAGCNALDYALDGPAKIYAIDANPRQNALLELKLAAIRKLDFDDFFAIFGDGFHPNFRALYQQHLRSELTEFARSFWDEHSHWFTSKHGSFYFHGLAGFVARGFRAYFRLHPELARSVNDMFACTSMEEQRRVYDERVSGALWTPTVNWILGRQLTMSLLGVPQAQRRLVQKQHQGGVAGFVREAIEYVFRQLPASENYFWRVYLTGRYTRDCCPSYLKRENFEKLRGGLADCIEMHTCTVTEFLDSGTQPISRFVLLDHMDWMSSYYPAALLEEWNAIFKRATPNARIMLRSAHAEPPFLDWVTVGKSNKPLSELLSYERDEAARLQLQDRIQTYPGFRIADLRADASF
jgi:S-adenosylmethionine-diacylglycerol 3-amino-3-carboxypropyl transferase